MAFQSQARHCRALGSPFTADICDLLAEHLSADTALGARVLGWPGTPDAAHDSVPLRLAAGLHALAFRNVDAAWSALYPPAPGPTRETLGHEIIRVLTRFDKELLPWLELPPQTNEVGRSAVLMSGLLFLAAQRDLPFSLYEIGSSGGLNLLLDRFRYTLGSTDVGPESPVHLMPKWTGPSPTPAKVRVAARRGVDQAPVDVSTPFGRQRLMAYVWPDQIERLGRVRNALAIAATSPPPVETMDGSAWVEHAIPPTPVPSAHRVLMHSVALQYFSEDGRRRVAAHAEKVGAQATTLAPFSWMRMEQGKSGVFELRVRTWPGGADQLLATVHAHGTAIHWLAT